VEFRALTSRVSGKEMLRGDRSCYFAGVINGAKYKSVGKWEIDSTMIGNNNLIMHEDGYIGEIPYQVKMTILMNLPFIRLKEHGRIAIFTEKPLSTISNVLLQFR
jgi:hypothetical protein